MPICTRCNEDKDCSCFEWRHDTKKYRSTCKQCRNVRFRLKYPVLAKKLSEQRKAIRANNAEDANRKARERYWKHRDERLIKAKARHKRDKVKECAATKKYVAANRVKINAHQSVHRALKCGKITKPTRCQMCSTEGSLHAHHHDYAKPNEVIWLCVTCHHRIHSKFFNQDLRDRPPFLT